MERGEPGRGRGEGEFPPAAITSDGLGDPGPASRPAPRASTGAGFIQYGEQRIADLFARGNYAAVARHGGPDTWQTYAALGLIGRVDAALAGLDRFGNPEARFYSGVASFIAGDEARAVRVLESVPTEHARNLCRLLRKPRIRILAQVPWVRQGAQDYLTPAERDGRFEIANVSFDGRDRTNAPYADVLQFIDPRRMPDFYLAAMVEFHLLPPNLRALRCPIIGQISDYDLHIQVLHPWLRLFDELIVTDETEWHDVQGLAPTPISTFPKSLGAPDELPPVERTERPIDVVFSGTVMHPYNHEKATLVRQVLEMPDIDFRVVDGHLWYPVYLGLLGQAKVSFTHQRRPGSATTRGLEALAMGCGMIVQRGSVLELFLREEEDGIFCCDVEGGELAATVRRVLARWQHHACRTDRWAAVARRQFGMSRVALEYLRFLTFLAARPRAESRSAPTEQPEQKRAILWKGPMHLSTEVAQQLRELNMRRWMPRVATSVVALNDLARELILEVASAGGCGHPSPACAALLRQLLAFCWKQSRLFPQSLVLRFNLIRAALHCGEPTDVRAALERAAGVLREPPARWRVAANEDVMPFDFAPMFFDYRGYFDLITQHLRTAVAVESELVVLIRASLHHYLGWYTNDVRHFEQAVRLDPHFAYYGFSLAQALLARHGPGDDECAVLLLEELAGGSVVFVEALELLRLLHEEGRYASRDPEALFRLQERASSLVRYDDQRLGLLRPAVIAGAAELSVPPPSSSS